MGPNQGVCETQIPQQGSVHKAPVGGQGRGPKKPKKMLITVHILT